MQTDIKNSLLRVYGILLVFFLLITGLPTFAQRYFSMPDEIAETNYLQGVVIFKMKEHTTPSLKAEAIDLPIIEMISKEYDALQLKKVFPNHTPPSQKNHVSGQPLTDLSRIYRMQIADNSLLEQAINELYATGLVEYAQPYYLPQLLAAPDDPFTGSQYYLNNIKAWDAWEIQKGDTTVIIAITDTGTDLLHPDLAPNRHHNYWDPVNGLDDDNDGYIDNFQGWDTADNDNNPQWDVNAHGVHVAGIASAATNNGTGMAGVGYNSRLMPIKISDSDGRLTGAYEGIIYAADQGAQVINCSWGGSISAGQFGQDIINYAVLNRDAVVIAAAGNSNNQIRIYPASYLNTISVAATDINDVKWSGSSYGKLVDLSAPGSAIFSTWPNGSYTPSSGTSMASPVVAGAAALLRAQFPEYNALQIAAQLKVTTDVIDTIAANASYAGLLGTGRLNIYRALTETDHPFLMFVELEHPLEHYQLFNPGESFMLGAKFLNLLSAAENMTALLSTTSPYIQLSDNESTLGQIGHNETATNFEDPFQVLISEDIPASHEVTFTITFFDQEGNYAGEENFYMTFNLDYIDFRTSALQTTVNSKGNVGFNYPNYNQGVGFLYENANQNRTMIEAAGIIAGKSTSSVVDNVYGPMENSFTNFFFTLENARQVDNPTMGDILIKGSFNDSLAKSYQIGLQMDYRVYAFDQSDIDNFLILEYDIINISGENIPGLYAGYYVDWILEDVRNHRVSFDLENTMGYSYSANGGNYSGIQMLSHNNVNCYSFDNQGFGGSLKVNDGFTSFEKYTAMKSVRANAGFFDKDNDVSTLISTGPFNLASNDTLKVAFALIAGDHLNDLQASAQLASLVYKGEFTGTQTTNQVFAPALEAWPNPVGSTLNIRLNQVEPNAILQVTDITGRQLFRENVETHAHTETITINTSTWPSGIYIVSYSSNQGIKTIKIMR